MANKREIVKRRKSVGNIHKITKTMEMIATARYKKAMDRALGGKPYSEKISELVRTLSAGGGQDQHPLLQENRGVDRVILLSLTSNRGLCGGYNANVNRLTLKTARQLQESGSDLELRVSGRKGTAFCRFSKLNVVHAYGHFDEKTGFADVETLANEFIDLYVSGRISGVKVVYTYFESAARHYAKVLDLLPLSGLSDTDAPQETDAPQGGGLNLEQYIFTPSADEILERLIPTMVRMQLYQCFTDAIVAEQMARMTAMKAATDNADQLIKSLGRQYNRARQSQITNELLDILGGVEALK